MTGLLMRLLEKEPLLFAAMIIAAGIGGFILLFNLLENLKIMVVGYPPQRVLDAEKSQFDPDLEDDQVLAQAPITGPDPAILFDRRVNAVERRMDSIQNELKEIISRLPPLAPPG